MRTDDLEIDVRRDLKPSSFDLSSKEQFQALVIAAPNTPINFMLCHYVSFGFVVGIHGEKESLWLHVDAAYAGTAFVCPEYRHWLEGVAYANSIAFNPSKWMMVHFDCTAMWVRNAGSLHRTFNVDPLYLQHENTGLAVDYMHWQIQLSKRFRALKLWFTIRSFGVNGLQEHVRRGVLRAKQFEDMVKADWRFEVPVKRHLGMVVFRLRGDNEMTEMLLKKLNSSGKLHCVPASIKGNYIIRFTVTSTRTTLNDIQRDWSIIQGIANQVIAEFKEPGKEPSGLELAKKISRAGLQRVPLGEIRQRDPNFGTSLILANIVGPITPKFVNGSFAAIFDNQDILSEFQKKISKLKKENAPEFRRKLRGMFVTPRQLSFDSRLMTTRQEATAQLQAQLQSVGEVQGKESDDVFLDDNLEYETRHRTTRSQSDFVLEKDPWKRNLLRMSSTLSSAEDSDEDPAKNNKL
ncbi:unnamed protein product [Cyprideis torosa]|uniref:Histidine decarboxylase n=1 Tax=Cyprideis torosa TaxID=163714 RepID=A0A7R8ZSD0_9CRUS|nr:unnamed protein product [Cyprideis torosa]CAG0895261.1 unnamed protein product [Cyprideis torosa]